MIWTLQITAVNSMPTTSSSTDVPPPLTMYGATPCPMVNGGTSLPSDPLYDDSSNRTIRRNLAGTRLTRNHGFKRYQSHLSVSLYPTLSRIRSATMSIRRFGGTLNRLRDVTLSSAKATGGRFLSTTPAGQIPRSRLVLGLGIVGSIAATVCSPPLPPPLL